MLKASETYYEMADLLARNIGNDEDSIDEFIILAYIGLRFKPLLNKYPKQKEKFDTLASIFADNYFDYAISLDYSINALYNYINKTHKLPNSDYLEIQDNMLKFIKDNEKD